MNGPVLDPGFATDSSVRLLSPAARVAAMCRFEAALVRASAVAGVVPDDAAAAIAAACERGVADPDAVLAEGWEAGTPVIPLLDRLRADLHGPAAEWLHHGATTQDVVDTAQLLLARDVIGTVRQDLVSIAATLREIAVAHRGTATTAWTLLQPAVPTTIGRRTVSWLDPMVNHLRALRELPSTFPVQLGGPTGTLAEFGDTATAVVADVADELDLTVPRLPWHTDRSPVRQLTTVVADVAATCSKVGTDLALLSHQGRVRMRAGRSSSMAAKRNPIDAVRAIAAADACAATACLVLRSRPQELERGIGGWHTEWFGLPLVLHTCAAAVEGLRQAVTSLEFVEDTESVEGGPTFATDTAVSRVLTACDRELLL